MVPQRAVSPVKKVDLAHVLAPLLTKDEFLAVYAVNWVAQAFECYGAADMTEIEQETVFGSLGQEILHGIRILSRAGYSFQNITLDERECPVLRDDWAETSGNLSYCAVLATGKAFNYLKAVDTAIELMQVHNLQLDPRPLKQARSELQETLAQWSKDMPPEMARQIVEDRQKRMKHAAELLNTPTRQVVN